MPKSTIEVDSQRLSIYRAPYLNLRLVSAAVLRNWFLTRAGARRAGYPPAQSVPGRCHAVLRSSARGHAQQPFAAVSLPLSRQPIRSSPDTHLLPTLTAKNSSGVRRDIPCRGSKVNLWNSFPSLLQLIWHRKPPAAILLITRLGTHYDSLARTATMCMTKTWCCNDRWRYVDMSRRWFTTDMALLLPVAGYCLTAADCSCVSHTERVSVHIKKTEKSSIIIASSNCFLISTVYFNKERLIIHLRLRSLEETRSRTDLIEMFTVASPDLLRGGAKL